MVFEPTGSYHHGFERQLADAGLPLCKVNPRQARRFAEAIGRHAKTDAVDAAMLARLAALLEPPVRPVISARLDEMKELHVARRALVKDRTAACNRDHTRRAALLKRQSRHRMNHLRSRWSVRRGKPVFAGTLSSPVAKTAPVRPALCAIQNYKLEN